MSRVKCSVFIAMSLDGFIARSDGNIDWLTDGVEDGEDYGYQSFYASVDCLVIGRKTYETALSFAHWPYGGRKVVVLSSRRASPGNRTGTDVLMVSAGPEKVVEELGTMGFTHAYIDGGKTIQSFLRAGLVNEMTVTIIPILLGDGVRLFGPVDADVRMKLIETRSFPNGFIQAMYKVADT
jgi:dihydrofolate reductase